MERSVGNDESQLPLQPGKIDPMCNLTCAKYTELVMVDGDGQYGVGFERGDARPNQMQDGLEDRQVD